MLGPATRRSLFGRLAASRRLRRLALGGMALALLVTSVGALAASNRVTYRLTVPGAEPTVRGPVKVRGASVAQRALFDDILAGLLDSRIASVRVDAPPPDYEPQDPLWLYIGVRVNQDTDYVRALWQASLVAGLFRDVSAERGLPLPGGKTFILVHPDGREEIFTESLIAQPQQHSVQRVATPQLEQELRSALRNENLPVRSLRFTRPLDRAGIELSVTTDDPSGFLRSYGVVLHRLIGRTLEHGRPRAEGAYIEVRDAAGGLVYGWGHSIRTADTFEYTPPVG